MAVDPQLLERILRTPESRDVRDSPVVTAVILSDPANAADLVPALDLEDEIRSANARRILCLFGAGAVPHLLGALRTAGFNARKEGIDVLWTLLLGEEARTVREVLTGSADDLTVLLDDRRPLPDDLPDHIEHDFRGRLCDQAYLVLRQVLDPEFDQSPFRALDERGRDEEIARLKRGRFALHIA